MCACAVAVSMVQNNSVIGTMLTTSTLTTPSQQLRTMTTWRWYCSVAVQ
jgi:hypothetical protein